MPPYPRILLNAAAPQTDAPAAVLVTTNINTSLPRRASQRPEAGEHHKQNFSNLSYPHETAMNHFSGDSAYRQLHRSQHSHIRIQHPRTLLTELSDILLPARVGLPGNGDCAPGYCQSVHSMQHHA
jgi:hypothetical protein